MFAINTLIQSLACSEKNRSEKYSKQKIGDFSTICFDTAIIIIATLATCKVFPKDYFSKNQIKFLQFSALTISVLDLFSFVRIKGCCKEKAKESTENAELIDPLPVEAENLPQEVIIAPVIAPVVIAQALRYTYTSSVALGESCNAFDMVFAKIFENNTPLPSQYFCLKASHNDYESGRNDLVYQNCQGMYVAFPNPQSDEEILRIVAEQGRKSAYFYFFKAVTKYIREAVRGDCGLHMDEDTYITAYNLAREACRTYHNSLELENPFSLEQYQDSAPFIHAMIDQLYRTAEKLAFEFVSTKYKHTYKVFFETSYANIFRLFFEDNTCLYHPIITINDFFDSMGNCPLLEVAAIICPNLDSIQIEPEKRARIQELARKGAYKTLFSLVGQKTLKGLFPQEQIPGILFVENEELFERTFADASQGAVLACRQHHETQSQLHCRPARAFSIDEYLYHPLFANTIAQAISQAAKTTAEEQFAQRPQRNNRWNFF